MGLIMWKVDRGDMGEKNDFFFVLFLVLKILYKAIF